MKKVFFTIFGGAAIILLVLLLVNCLRTWNLCNVSVGDMSKDFFDIELSNGYVKENFSNELKYTDYGGEVIIQIDLSNSTQEFDDFGEEYEMLAGDEINATDDVYEQMYSMFGLEKNNITEIYRTTTEVKRTLFSMAEPDHATIWICISKDEENNAALNMAYIE